MTIAGAVIIYILVWWSVFFTLLPTGIKSVWEEEEDGHGKGVDQGAPVDPGLKGKAIRTTWISAIVSVIIIGVIESGIINYS